MEGAAQMRASVHGMEERRKERTAPAFCPEVRRVERRGDLERDYVRRMETEGDGEERRIRLREILVDMRWNYLYKI